MSHDWQMKLMALTFLRTSELIGGKWTELDFEAARWDVPAVRMKMKSVTSCPWLDRRWRCLKCCMT
jgi:integrase